MQAPQKKSSKIRQIFYVFHPIGLLIENMKYKLGKRNFVSKYLITSFLFFGGYPGSFFSKFQGQKKIKFQGNGILNLNVNAYTALTKKTLKSEGFLLFPGALNENEVNHLLEFSLSTPGSTRQMDSGTGLAHDVFFNRENPATVRFDYAPNDLLKDPVVQKLIADPVVLRIAQDYLGSLPILDFVAMWWHTQSPNPDKEAAQYFHFDMDRLRWIKFFFYITDVDKDSGPHIFVPKSQSNSGLPFGLRKKGYTRLEDNEVSFYFSPETWQEFVGPKGSMIVEDTRGLHKGKHVKAGDRLVFQIQYTSSLFGTDTNKLELGKTNIGSNFQELFATCPKILQNVNIID